MMTTPQTSLGRVTLVDALASPRADIARNAAALGPCAWTLAHVFAGICPCVCRGGWPAGYVSSKCKPFPGCISNVCSRLGRHERFQMLQQDELRPSKRTSSDEVGYLGAQIPRSDMHVMFVVTHENTHRSMVIR